MWWDSAKFTSEHPATTPTAGVGSAGENNDEKPLAQNTTLFHELHLFQERFAEEFRAKGAKQSDKQQQVSIVAFRCEI